MGLRDFLRGRKAAIPPPTRTPGTRTVYLGGDQGSARRMTSFKSLLGAVSIPNVWKCVSVIGANASATPLLFKDQDDREVDLKSALPDLYQLLRQPNPEMKGSAFRQAIALDLLLCGNCFILLDDFDGLGRPHALYRWSPERARILRSETGGLAYGVDVVQDGVTRTEWYDQTSVLHVRTFFNPRDPLFGLGPTEAAELSLSRDRLIGEYTLNFFQKGAVVDSVLTTPNEISEEDRRALVADFTAMRSGNRNKFKTALLWAGADYKKIQESVGDVQLPALAQMSLEDVCQSYGCPKQMLGDFRESNYRNSQEANAFFVSETLTPLLRQIEEELWQPLVDLFDDGLVAEYDIREVNDFQLRCDSALKLAQSGAATVNDVLVMSGLDPRDDEIGDRLVQPQGVTLLEPEQVAQAALPPAPTVTEVTAPPAAQATEPPVQAAQAPGGKSAPQARRGYATYPKELLSHRQREEQRRRGLKQWAPQSPVDPLLRLLAGSEVAAGAGAPAPESGSAGKARANGRVTVSGKAEPADTALVAAAYRRWAEEADAPMWDALEEPGNGHAG